ncbi:MAG: response regulator transcription factor [Leptospiraceae bacterium]|nr:response regulator transcription factor [Leptospiraceae bacterium]MCP5502458.1 response regulator transcription factor [Leptospiraceae bacterium]
MSPKLLLVEDDRSLGATLKDRLKKEGYDISWVESLENARKELQMGFPDLLILDVGLPDGSGFELAKELGQKPNPPPFLFLTAVAGAQDRLRGFELGAEEFIPKPFHLKELLLRVKHVLDAHRHVYEALAFQRSIEYKNFTIDFKSYTIQEKDKPLQRLAVRDMNLLALLISQKHRVVSRDEILDKLWGEDSFPTNRTIDNAIVRLRQIFGENGQEAIQSVRGVGYRWIGEIH